MKELFLLDPDAYVPEPRLFGGLPTAGFERYQEWQRELEREPVDFLARERRFGGLLESARLELAAYLGADATTLAFTPNARSPTPRPACSRSSPATRCSSATVSMRETATVVVRGGAHRAPVRASRSRQPVPGPKTRAIFCSHVEWTSGQVNDIAAVCEPARDAGVITIVYGARAGPDRTRSRVVRSRRLRRQLPQVVVRAEGRRLPVRAARGAADDRTAGRLWDWEDGSGFAEQNRWQGTRVSAHWTVPAAIDFQAQHDWPSVRDRCHALRRARDLLPLEPLTEDFVQMLGFAFDGPDPAGLTKGLFDEHRVEVPVFETAGGWVLLGLGPGLQRRRRHRCAGRGA